MTITLSQNHTVTLSHNHIIPHLNTITLPHYLTVDKHIYNMWGHSELAGTLHTMTITLSHYLTVDTITLPHIHTITLSQSDTVIPTVQESHSHTVISHNPTQCITHSYQPH